MEFGQYPFTVYIDSDGVYNVSPEHQANADECGVNHAFDRSRLNVMAARAQAYGYTVSVVDAPVAPASTKKG